MTYLQYVAEQSAINERKFALTSLTLDEVEAVARYYRAHRSAALSADRFFGLAQGVRNGAEIRAFAGRLGRRVIGTDISSTILAVPDGVLCDFSRCPELWRGKVDFLYSNSYDHAADLDVTLKEWHALLSPDGLMFLQFTPAHQHDIGISLEALLDRLRRCGFAVEEVIAIRKSAGLRRLLDSLANGVRQIGKRLIRPLIPGTSRLHWTIGYRLRRGVLVDTKVIVAHR